jgi:DNA repair exonuclease SbcCD ATPase subunit
LYAKLDELKPDLVINTGDMAHTKTQISPELVEMIHEHIREVSERAPYHIILGNHDLNLMNQDRQDAITPIVESMKLDNVFLHKTSGRKVVSPDLSLWVFSLADSNNYPTPLQWKDNNTINIGLFHGSVANCVTDSNFHMTHVEYDLSIFDGLDYAFLGDIHKQQFFLDGRIAYAGSLIQQNFGEEIDKGFLYWEIEDKKKFTVTPYMLKGSKKFYTLKLNNDLSIQEGTDIEEGSRIRISPPKPITLVQQKEIEKAVKKTFKPHDVITLSYVNIDSLTTAVDKKQVAYENLRQIDVQEKLIRDFLKDRNLDEKIYEKILDLNRKYQINVDQREDITRNIEWKINKIAWNNLFNYGEGNVIDFSQLGGLTGLFAPNMSGKSNMIDAMMETCFDSTTKGINKNIFLINDNKDIASMVADITANDQNYVIERTIERVKYGHRKLDELKEWGKTSVNFYSVDDTGAKELLVGTLRPETERNIRQKLGTFEDFMLTSLSAQWNVMDIIAVKETKRKEILYKFLDLDVFEQKCLLAKDESRQYVKLLGDLEENGIEELVIKCRKHIEALKRDVTSKQESIDTATTIAEKVDEDMIVLSSQRLKIGSAIDPNISNVTLERVEREIKSLTTKVAEYDEKLSPIEADITKIEKLEKKFDVKLHMENAKKFEDNEKAIEDLNETINALQKELDMHLKNAAILNEVPCGNSFPKCKFLINAYASREKISGLSSDMIGLDEDVDRYTTENESLYKFVEKLSLYNKFVGERNSLEYKRDNILLQKENLKLKLEKLIDEKQSALDKLVAYEKSKDDVKYNESLDSQISELRKKKNVLTTDIKILREEMSQLNRSLGSEQGILEKISSQLSLLQETRDYCTAFEHYVAAMGKDGIAYNILTQKLPLINEEINKILSNATDFNVFIEHDEEEQSIRIFLQYGQYKRRLLELGSGAEKMLASVAIRTALLNISNLPKTNMFIIDEGFGKLDPKNLEAVGRMFDYLKSVYEHVLVISHVDTMKDMIDNIIDITTDEEGYAHVEVGGS